MKEELKKQFGWFMGLSALHKVYLVYFAISFAMLLCEYNPCWVSVLLVVNFGNSVRLMSRVPIDDLED